MPITFSGLSTGLDTDSIIDSLMQIERAPIDRLEARKTAETERINAYFQFKGLLEELKSSAQAISLTSQVRNSGVTLSDDAPLSASASGATDGSYDISVAQLASVQKTVTDGWSSASDSLLGTGTITIDGVDIAISAENNSLNGLASTINDMSETLGVTASIMNDGDPTNPYRLVLTGNDTSSAFTVTSNLVDGASSPIAFNTTDTATAQQAEVYIDGIKVLSDSNTITDAISGLTLNLESTSTVQSAGPPPVYETTNMTIAPDNAPVKEKITAFVTSYNNVMDWILSGYEEFGGASTTTPTEDGEESEQLLGSVLRGDSTINSIKRGLQNILSEAIGEATNIQTMSQLGITTQLNGKLNLDTTTMEKAVDDNPEDIVSLLSGTDSTDGIMKRFNFYLGDLTAGANNMYANKKTSYDQAVRRIDKQITFIEPRLEKREASLRAQFGAMEALVSSLNSQSDFLAQQLSNLSRDN